MQMEEYSWEIGQVQERYASLQLSVQQAWQIYQYEQQKLAFKGNHFFSDWEEWDYERSVFEKILSKEQFERFARDLDDAIGRYVETLPEHDNSYHKQVAYTLEVIQYYREQFIPAVAISTSMVVYIRDDLHKIDFLKAAYKQHWLQTRQQSLINHFRHYRRYMPIALQYTLLQHTQTSLWPEYGYFRSTMDEPTRAVDDHMRHKMKIFSGQPDPVLQQKMEEKRSFFDTLHDKYYKEDEGGWHVVISNSTPEEEKTDLLMTLLLVDKELYQFNEIMLT